MFPKLLLGVMAILLLLAGCASGDPVAVVEDYLRAKVDSDLPTLQRLSCAAWESQALVEATSFESMNASLEGMACQQAGDTAGYTLVECAGKITTVYNGETREWDLGAFPYQVVQENGEWRMCGYADSQ